VNELAPLPRARIVGPTTAGRIGGVLLLCGAVAIVATGIADGTFTQPASVDRLVAVLAALFGAVALLVPWRRFGPDATVVMVPFALALVTYGNYDNPDPYLSGLSFLVIAVWVGVSQRRFVMLALGPVIGILYWWPLSRRDPLPTLVAASVVLAVVSVIIGELLALLGTRLAEAHRRSIGARERRFARLVQRSVDVIVVFDEDNVVRYVSPALTDMFGYRTDEVLGLDLVVLLDGFFRGFDVIELQRFRASGGRPPLRFDEVTELGARHADGRWVDVEYLAQDQTDDPDIGGVVVHVRDITTRKRLERDLKFQAFHDELTELPNRTSFRAMVADAITYGGPVAVIYIDLDGFKVVNDTTGHSNGDRLLRLVAERLRARRHGDLDVARLGGDEFAVVVQSGADDAEREARALVAALEEPFAMGPTQVVIAASAGVAPRDGGQSADELIGEADMAMYRAKSEPATAVVRFEPRMRDELVERIEIETMLRRGLERGEFAVHYQPVVDLTSGEMTGAEALVRWNHPVRGLVGPGEFIGIAEDSGLIVPIGRWVMVTACRDATTWQPSTTPRTVAVNVSARQFQDPGLVEDIRTALRDSGLPPEQLVIEVTESLLITDTEAASRRLHEIRALGVRLALDDFGTGYSSLSYLRSLPFDVLKIDQSFVAHATTDPSDLALVQTINRLGHDLGLQTLVEGIETAEQAQLVANLRCDRAQGYHFSRPIPIEQLVALWEDRRTADAPSSLA